MTFEKVTWVDSGMSFAQRWMSEEEIGERIAAWNGKNVTVGHVVLETETVLVLIGTRDTESEAWAGAMAIYKPCIIERVQLGSNQ